MSQWFEDYVSLCVLWPKRLRPAQALSLPNYPFRRLPRNSIITAMTHSDLHASTASLNQSHIFTSDFGFTRRIHAGQVISSSVTTTMSAGRGFRFSIEAMNRWPNCFQYDPQQATAIPMGAVFGGDSISIANFDTRCGVMLPRALHRFWHSTWS